MDNFNKYVLESTVVPGMYLLFRKKPKWETCNYTYVYGVEYCTHFPMMIQAKRAHAKVPVTKIKRITLQCVKIEDLA